MTGALRTTGAGPPAIFPYRVRVPDAADPPGRRHCVFVTTRCPIPPELWADPRHRRGLDGEHCARAYLESRGWVIAAHRFKLGRLELDLVARRGGVVAFVEVKTRCSSRFGRPGEAVGWRKQRSLAQVATAWILRHGRWGETYRFDVVEVFVGFGGHREVQHVEDAWRIVR